MSYATLGQWVGGRYKGPFTQEAEDRGALLQYFLQSLSLMCRGSFSSRDHKDTNLMDVLAEGRHRCELTDEVQVGCTQSVERTAVVGRQILFIDLGYVLW